MPIKCVHLEIYLRFLFKVNMICLQENIKEYNTLFTLKFDLQYYHFFVYCQITMAMKNTLFLEHLAVPCPSISHV